MSALLERRTDGTVRMFYAGQEAPWHREGTQVAEAVVAKQAIKLAGLDWKTRLEPIFDSRQQLIPNRHAVVRDEDNRVLGIVGDRYQPIQNETCFDFLDSLYADGLLRYGTAGSLKGGSTVWMQAELSEGMTVMDDVYKRFLLASTSHDGTRGLTVHNGNVRVVCDNTLVEATREMALTRITHSGDVFAKMEEARKLLKVIDAQSKRMAEWLTKLSKVEVTDKAFEDFRTKMLGPLDDATPTQRRNAIEAFIDIYNAEAEHAGKNAYSLVNAVTGYADHHIRVKTGSSKLESTISGRTNLIKTTGLKLVTQLAGAAR